MSYTIRLTRTGTGTVYTFAAPTPWLSGTREQSVTENQPPLLASIDASWVIEGVFYGTETTLWAQWNALKAAIETPGSYPDGVELVQNTGSTVVEAITAAAGYIRVRVIALEVPRTDVQWRTEIRFKLKVMATKRFVLSGTTLSAYKTTQTWNYDPAGLAQITFTGDLEVTTGSAVAAARAIGGLALPGGNYTYETAGPEGMDVEQVNNADLKARFTSVIRELGAAPPGNVSAGFSVVVATQIVGGDTIKKTTVTAQGPGAVAAVAQYRPGTTITEETTADTFQRRASGVFLERTLQALKYHRFTVSGGGRRILWSGRSGGRPPAKHIGAFRPVTVTEEFRFEFMGDPDSSKLKAPAILTGLIEDLSTYGVTGPEVVEWGKTAASTRWAFTLRRGYSSTSFAAAAMAIFAAVVQDSAQRGSGQIGEIDALIAKPDLGIVPNA